MTKPWLDQLRKVFGSDTKDLASSIMDFVFFPTVNGERYAVSLSVCPSVCGYRVVNRRKLLGEEPFDNRLVLSLYTTVPVMGAGKLYFWNLLP